MREIRAEKLLIKTEKLLKRFVKILWQNKLKLFLALLGVVAITGGVILATGGSFTINKLSLTDGLVGYWSLDAIDIAGATAYDKSGQGNDGTLVSDPAKTAGKIGQALEFDGVNDYVNLGTMGDFGSTLENNYSFSAWVKSSTATTFGIWGGYDTGENSTFIKLNEAPDGTDNQLGKIRVFTEPWGSQATDRLEGGVDSNTGITDGEYHHLVVNFMPLVNTLEVWLDGVSKTIAYNVQTIDNDENYRNFAQDVYLGALNLNVGINSPMTGSMDEVRIYNRALSQEEITRLYKMGEAKVNASQNLKLTDGLVGMWSFDGPDIDGVTAYDRSGLGNDGTITNGPIKTMGKIGQALEFDGTNDYVYLGTKDSLHVNEDETSEFFISAWIKMKSDRKSVIVKRGSWSTPYFASYSMGTWWSRRLYFTYINESFEVSELYTPAGGPLCVLNEWCHVACGANATDIYCYVNNQYAGSDEKVTGTSYTDYKNTYIGTGDSSSFLIPFDGTIDEVRIYNRDLSVEEINRLYKMGESKLNASQNLKLTDGLVGSWSFNGPDIDGATALDKSGQGNDGTITGTTKTIGKVGQGLDFDGDGDEVVIGSAVVITYPLTINVWFKANGLADGILAAIQSHNSPGENSFSIKAEDTSVVGVRVEYNNTWSYGFTTSSYSVGAWHMATAVLTSSINRTIYIDGGNSGTDTTDLTPNNLDETKIGAGITGAWDFDGTIDEFRVYNRALSATEITRLYNMGR